MSSFFDILVVPLLFVDLPSSFFFFFLNFVIMHPECTVTSFSRSEHRDHMRYLTVQPLAANTNSDDAYKEGVYVSSTHLLYELFFLTRCCEEPRV